MHKPTCTLKPYSPVEHPEDRVGFEGACVAAQLRHVRDFRFPSVAGSIAPRSTGSLHLCAVLRKALRNVLDGNVQVKGDPVSFMGRQPAPEPLDLGRVSNGFLFFDWFAIPQITARQAGINEDITKSDAARAVRSIPAYVEAAELFIAVVPGSRHSSTGAECNYLSWMSRGCVEQST